MATRTQKHKPLVFTEGFGWHRLPPCEGTQITKTVATWRCWVSSQTPVPVPTPPAQTKRLVQSRQGKPPLPPGYSSLLCLGDLNTSMNIQKELVSHWESSDNYLQTITAVSYARTSERLGRGNAIASDRQENLPWHLCAAVKSSPNLNAEKKENPVSITFKFHF